jgi:CelD/BcsL family acetyltransferase involved in cellulose biosynthesis
LREGLAALADWDWVHWHGISVPLAQAMDEQLAPQWYSVSDDYVLDLPSSWEEFHSGLRRNIRESLRHCYNSLRRDGYGFEFVIARTPAEIRPALERFVELHAMRARMAHGPRHPNHFAGQQLREFLYDVCDRLARRDAVRVFQLRIGGEVVAARVAFVVGDGLYLYYSGFDPAWAPYSVMTTTVAESLKYAIAQGLSTANLSLAAEQSKLRWSPRRVELRSGLVHRARLRSRIASGLYHLAMSKRGVSGRLLHRLLMAGRRPWN